MKCYSRRGKLLTLAEWYKKYTDKENSFVEVTEDDKVYIRTAWVGLVMDFEEDPKLFIVQVFDKTQNKEIVERTLRRWPEKLPPVWFATEESAREMHMRLEFELRVEPKKRKNVFRPAREKKT